MFLSVLLRPLRGHWLLLLCWVLVACGAGKPTVPDETAVAASSDTGSKSASSDVAETERAAPETQPKASSAPAADSNAAPSIAEPPAPKTSPPLPSGTTVLHIGDSFAGALGHELNRELETHGIKGVLQYEKSTYIPTWASKKELPTYLSRYKPDLILVTLGGNELSIVRPEQRAETVRRLVARFGDTPCVWIGIPLWEGANPTLMQVVRDNVEQCLFFDSHALIPDMQRAKDKIHPSLSARTHWAKTVVEWLQQQREPAADKPWALKRQ